MATRSPLKRTKQTTNRITMFQTRSSVLICPRLLDLMPNQTFKINLNSSNNLRMKTKTRTKSIPMVMKMITCIYKWVNRINSK